MAHRLQITVLLGGPSAEREVSLRSGAAVAHALRSFGHEVTSLDPQREDWELPAETEVVFLALHGTYGEDGTVQKKLEKLGVPYTGCGAESSAIAFDKLLTKELCLAAGISTPRFRVIPPGPASWPAGWKAPVVLKPIRQGSSVGLAFIENQIDFPSALEQSRKFGADILMEEKVSGRETTVGILDGQALPMVEVKPRKGPYDYHNKYTAGATEYFCPADFSQQTTQAIQGVALGAFEAVGGRDYGRVDVMVDEAGQPFVLEVNTLPGMTETSLFPKAAAAAGISYRDLCQRMVDLALRRSMIARS